MFPNVLSSIPHIQLLIDVCACVRGVWMCECLNSVRVSLFLCTCIYCYCCFVYNSHSGYICAKTLFYSIPVYYTSLGASFWLVLPKLVKSLTQVTVPYFDSGLSHSFCYFMIQIWLKITWKHGFIMTLKIIQPCWNEWIKKVHAIYTTDAELRSLWLSLLFKSNTCLTKHMSTIVLLYNKCMLCISCHFRPLKHWRYGWIMRNYLTFWRHFL